ncbi:hypothetical protein ATL41_1785 [Flavimobilis soli]|uniref:Inner membrane protein n=1 Tax=Flavimobilis soli TaxID=442709 RepID=A0A2A9EER1_9MICO|nr:hypothetical protein [Flavimobilis soli]PFG37041.1 hypothetical protein ATL41_1785 [Flavimobilis soli]
MYLEIIGWIGSAILVWSLMQTRILRLRIFNLIGCFIHIGYNFAFSVWPMVGLNVVLAVINIVQLRKLLAERHSEASYDVVPTATNAPYLVRQLTRHADDIAALNPGFDVADATSSGEAYLVLLGDETVGYVILDEPSDGVANIKLDYVVPRYRDFTPGEFVFRRSGLLSERGFRRVVSRPGVKDNAGTYYEALGFRYDPAADTYTLEVAA